MTESETMSVGTSNENIDDPVLDMPDEKLFQLLAETLQANEMLLTETQMFEKYMKRIEPKNAAGGHATSTLTAAQASQNEPGAGGGVSRVGRKRSKSRSSAMERMLKLTNEQKCDIAQREIEEYREEIQKVRDDSEKVLDSFKAIMEEADIRLGEIKKASYEFDRDIVKGSLNPRTGKIISEKAIRFFEDGIRSRDTLIEKLRLKNTTLRQQMKKLHLQLKQKEEMGEVLHEVDFNQLKIENQQYIEKIDERNQDLLDLKLRAGSTLQVLNQYKKKLHALTKESDRLKTEITSRQDLLSRIDIETVTVEEERAKAENINRRLRGQLADYKVPEVLEYVSEKANLYELQKKVRSWERKVEIAEMALKTHRKKWHALSMGTHQPNPWRAMEAV